METNVTIDVDINDLWEAVWSSEGSGVTYWASHIRTVDGKSIRLWTEDWTPNPQDFTIFDCEEEKWHTVTIADLVRAYGIAVKNGDTHCGDYLVADLEDCDECVGDVLLQYSVFGELIYG
jgi:hypothetical protein